MSAPVRIVAAPGDLEGLSLLTGARRIELRLPGLSPDLATPWQERLNRALGACGCGFAGFGLMACLPGALLWAFWLAPQDYGPGLRAALAFGALVLAAIAGKLVGLSWGQYRLRQELRAFRHWYGTAR